MLERSAPGISSDGDGRTIADERDVLDLGMFLRVIYHSKALIVFVVGICVLVGLGVLYFTPPTYTASSSVLLETPDVVPFEQEAVFLPSSLSPSEVESQLQIIRSDYLLGEVVDAYNLTEDPRFRAPPETLISRFVETLRSWSDDLPVVAPLVSWLDSNPVPSGEGLKSAIVDRLMGSISVSRVGLTYLLRIDVAWQHPDTAAFVANLVANTYIRDRLTRRRGEAELSSQWFGERVEELKARTGEAQQAIEQFRLENGIVDPGPDSALLQQQLTDLSRQISQTALDTLDAKNRLDSVRRLTAGNPMDATVLDLRVEPAISQLRAQYVTLELELSSSVRRYGADSAATSDVRQRMADIEASVQTELAKLEAAYLDAYETLQQRGVVLKVQLDALRGEAARTAALGTRLAGLQNEAGVYGSLYDAYLQRYMQTQQQQSLPAAEARVITEARPADGKAGPSSAMILGLSLAIGFTLALSIAFTSRAADNTVRTSAALRRATGLPTIGLLPTVTGGKRKARPAGTRERVSSSPPDQPAAVKTATPRRSARSTDKAAMTEKIEREVAPATPKAAKDLRLDERWANEVLDSPFSLFAETIRRIKVETDLAHGGKPPRVVGFVSAEPQLSRVTVATSYARLVATTKRTVLVDFDFRDATLTKVLTPGAASGLLEQIEAGQEVSELWRDAATGLDFIPARGALKARVERNVESEHLLQVVGDLLTEYDRVIIDLPPLSVAVEAAALQSLIGSYVLVASWGQTPRQTLSRALADSRLEDRKLAGAVLANVDLQRLRRYEL
jgi:succinoglycan biosynthesis transport protein ExoP